MLTSVAGLGLAACGDDQAQLSPSDTREHVAQVSGHEFEVRVPSGAITVTVGNPEQTIEQGSSEWVAPEGGALVPVEWRLDRYQEAPVSGFDQETRLSLVTDHDVTVVTTIPDAPTAAFGGSVVAVSGGGEVTAVEATYDDLTQRIDLDGSRDAGAAELLYEPGATTDSAECGADWRLEPRAQVEVECTARTWLLPYLPGAGWASEGGAHVVVEPTVSLWKVTSGNHQYRASLVSAGSVGDAVFQSGETGAATLDGMWVARSAQLPLRWTVEGTYRLRSSGDRGPWDGQEVTLVGGGVATR